MFHRYMKCLYIRLSIKKLNWKSNSSIVQIIKIKIAETIEEIKLIINRILKQDAKTTNKKKRNRTNLRMRITSKIKILFIHLLRCRHFSQSIRLCTSCWTAELWTARQIFMSAMIYRNFNLIISFALTINCESRKQSILSRSMKQFVLWLKNHMIRSTSDCLTLLLFRIFSSIWSVLADLQLKTFIEISKSVIYILMR
jgi:hypothetical protein